MPISCGNRGESALLLKESCLYSDLKPKRRASIGSPWALKIFKFWAHEAFPFTQATPYLQLANLKALCKFTSEASPSLTRMVEAFFSTTQMDSDLAHHHSLSQSQSHPFMLLSGPPSCGKTSLLFQFAYNVALEAENDRKVVFICHRSRIESAPPFLSQGIQPSSDIFKRIQMKYVEDDEGIKKYFAAFHLHDTFPLSVVVDDFGDFFHERKCQERYGNPRGRDLALVRILALCHNAVMSSNDKGHCKLLISDTHHGDSPRLLFLYKRWVPSIFTINGDDNGSFLLKNYSNVGSDNTEKMKIAKYTLVYQRLLLEGIVEDEKIDNHAVVSASVEQLIAAK